jgi:short-subunit dehydrogenase
MSTSPSSLGTAVVTGASAGLGKVYADRLAGRGYDLVLVARRAELLDAVAADLRARHGVNVRTLVADLSAAADVDKVASLLREDAAITLLVNNAGTSTLAPFAATSPAQIQAMNAINVDALVQLSRAVLPAFLARDKGTLINIGSVLGFFSLPVSTAYSGGKSYVLTFTRGLQDEVKDSRVVVQLVAPSATATDIWEISGVPLSALDKSVVMTAEDCVDAALAGLDLGEAVTLPSVENAGLFAAYDAARAALAAATQNGKPASRYQVK